MAEGTEELSRVVPVLVAALICDVAVADPASGKKSLIGIFDRINVAHFPTQHPMFLYFKVADAEGKYDLSIRFIYSKTNSLLAEARGGFNAPSRLMSVDNFVVFPPLAMVSPGRYEFHILANSIFLGAAFLDAVELSPTGELR